MAAYVVYSTEAGRKGKIVRVGSCPDSMLNIQAQAGQSSIRLKPGVQVDQRRMKVFAGNVVSRPKAEIDSVDADIKSHREERERKRK